MEINNQKKKITVLVPCYNEEDGIGLVIDGFYHISRNSDKFEIEVVVIDNNSKDRTTEVANYHGAKVIYESKQGKGNAIRTGFFSISNDTDYVVMLDGDNTYQSKEALRLIELLDSGFCSVALGSRMGGKISDGSMTAFNRAGNWIFSHLVRYIYQVNVTDVLTGYFAWNKESVERLRPHLISNGFAIEMEMITKMARLGEEIYCVPITYDKREGESSLHPIYDGFRILGMLLRNLTWRPELSIETSGALKMIFKKIITKK
jgi:dolichol-phosphate mannosyltransferase